MKKLMAVAGACLLAACSGQTVTGPDPVTQVPETPAPVAQATPAPQPVASPAPGAQHDAAVKGGFYSVTNETTVPQFYCAAAFGVLPGGDQGAHTNIYEDQGVRQPKGVFSGQAPKTAACQYERIQVDLTQSKDCRKFDWHNVLAAEVYDNPEYGKCPRPEPSPEPTPSPSPSPSPSPEPTCADLNPQPGAVTKSIAKVTTKHPGTPGTPAVTKTFYWYDAERGNDGPNIQNDCEAEGGTYYHQIKIPTGGNEEDVNVCKTPVNHGSSWEYDNNDFAVREATMVETITPAIPGTPDKYSVTVTLTYSIAAGAAQSRTFKIVYDPSDFVKKQVTVQTACGQAKSGTLVWGQGDQYNNSPNYAPNDGHVTGNYTAAVQ